MIRKCYTLPGGSTIQFIKFEWESTRESANERMVKINRKKEKQKQHSNIKVNTIKSSHISPPYPIQFLLINVFAMCNMNQIE